MYTIDDNNALPKPLLHTPLLHASALLTEPDKCPEYGSIDFLTMFPIKLCGEPLNEYRLRVLGAASNGYGD